MPATVISCPGKVLLAGGYLVLEPEHAGLVVGTASRFYTVVQPACSPSSSSSSTSETAKRIVVKSPQFREATWTYELAYRNDDDLSLTQLQDGTARNKFVQLALEAALKVALAQGHRVCYDLDVAIAGDNDFYSQDRSASTPAEPEPFAFLDTTLADVHKTGLGSSAAMVTSLVAAVLIHLSGTGSAVSHQLIHNVAQFAHSQAQGKVGSGFDVSAAIFGSQIYQRFSPDCLSALMDGSSITPSRLLAGLSPDSALWIPEASTSGSVKPFSLPPCTTLLLADVDAGSNTPSMVGKVLKWRQAAGADGDELWRSIASANAELADTFGQLSDLAAADREAYEQVVTALSQAKSADWSPASPAGRCFCNARKGVNTFRSRMKQMGELAQVPIEPDEQTRLLDACTNDVAGVIGGGVPGAGGYDAIWVLILSPPGTATSPAEEEIRSLWQGWKEMSVRPLSRKARIEGGQSGQSSGLQRHKLEDVQGLADAIKRQ